MLKTVAIVVVAALVVAVGAVLAIASTKPDICRFERSISVKAPPEKIYALLDDFRKWPGWSPYEHKDPAMKRAFSGAASGKGAVYEFDGDSNVGKGRITITEAARPNKLVFTLDMTSPMEAHNLIEFTLAPAADATRVTWTMTAQANLLAKVIQVFIDMDRMVGGDFEAGLANLKTMAEK